MEQCRCSLEEASKIRSFVNSVQRIVDLSFISVVDLGVRVALRRCFVTFAMVFHYNDWVLAGRGVPREVILSLFAVIMDSMAGGTGEDFAGAGAGAGAGGRVAVAPEEMLDTMERLNLIQTARGERRMEGRSPTSPRQGVGQAGGKSLFNGLMAVGVRDGGYDDGRVWDEDGKEDDGKGGGESYLMHESVSVRFGFCHVFTRVRRDVECGVFDFVLYRSSNADELRMTFTGCSMSITEAHCPFLRPNSSFHYHISPLILSFNRSNTLQKRWPHEHHHPSHPNPTTSHPSHSNSNKKKKPNQKSTRAAPTG